MKKIMMRNANNDFEAFLIAQAMESVGADVFSIAFNGQHQPFGALAPSSRFAVFAKIRDDALIAKTDEAIDKALEQV
jgi:hypothetical protein